jgi:nicotinamidase-related amidase
MKQALLLVDIQREYFPGGKVVLHEPERAAANAARLLAECRGLGVTPIHVQHAMPKERGVPFLLEGTEGQEIHPSVKPSPGEIVVRKQFPNAFRSTTLLSTLRSREIEHVIICGMMTHMCVDFTAKEAFDQGFKVSVVGDATATCALQLGGASLSAETVRDANLAALHGIVATVLTTDEMLGELRSPVLANVG